MRKFIPVLGALALCMSLNLDAGSITGQKDQQQDGKGNMKSSTSSKRSMRQGNQPPAPPASLGYMVTPMQQQDNDMVWGADFAIAFARAENSDRLIASAGAQNGGTTDIDAEKPVIAAQKYDPMYFARLFGMSTKMNKGLALSFQFINNNNRNVDQSDANQRLVPPQALDIIAQTFTNLSRAKSSDSTQHWRIELEAINMGFQSNGAFLHTTIGAGYHRLTYHRNSTYYSADSSNTNLYKFNHDAKRNTWAGSGGIHAGIGPVEGNNGLLLDVAIKHHYGITDRNTHQKLTNDDSGTVTYNQNQKRDDSSFVQMQDYEINARYMRSFNGCVGKISAGFFGQTQPDAVDADDSSSTLGASITTYGGKFGVGVTF